MSKFQLNVYYIYVTTSVKTISSNDTCQKQFMNVLTQQRSVIYPSEPVLRKHPGNLYWLRSSE